MKTAEEFYNDDTEHLFSDQKENEYKRATIALMEAYHTYAQPITTAPELLEHLESLVSWLREANIQNVLIDNCEKVVFKATE